MYLDSQKTMISPIKPPAQNIQPQYYGEPQCYTAVKPSFVININCDDDDVFV